MKREVAGYVNQKGLNKDLSVSKFQDTFIFDGRNIRLDSLEDNTLLTITNERGNVVKVSAEESLIQGHVIGYCVVQQYLVLFTTNPDSPDLIKDRIYRVESSYIDSHDPNGLKILFQGDLGWDYEHLIEAFGIIETSKVYKVYWTDGIHQPGILNILKEEVIEINDQVHFWRKINLTETVNITKAYTGGYFHSGTIQYAFTYWSINGVESNIFRTTDIFDISYSDRAGGPEDICNCNFTITLNNLDSNFDYLRIYSIQRTALTSESVITIVRDIYLESYKYEDTNAELKVSTVTYTDSGKNHTAYDINAFILQGAGEELIIGTMSTKDNTLFAGDIKVERIPVVDLELDSEDYVFDWLEEWPEIETNDSSQDIYKYIPKYTTSTMTSITNERIRLWKKNERYRFGIQFQHETGINSEVTYLTDVIPANTYKFVSDTTIQYPVLTFKFTSAGINKLQDLINSGYRRYRIVYVPLNSNRQQLMQGFVTNTISKVSNRANTNTLAAWAFPDYYTRAYPILRNDISIRDDFNNSTTIYNCNNDPLYYPRDLISPTVQNPSTFMQYNVRLGCYIRPVWQHFAFISGIGWYYQLTDKVILHKRSVGGYDYTEISAMSLQSTVFDNEGLGRQFGYPYNLNILDFNGGFEGDLTFEKNPYNFFIDSSILSFWSPDVEYSESITESSLSGITNLNISGIAIINSSFVNTSFLDTYNSIFNDNKFTGDNYFPERLQNVFNSDNLDKVASAFISVVGDDTGSPEDSGNLDPSWEFYVTCAWGKPYWVIPGVQNVYNAKRINTRYLYSGITQNVFTKSYKINPVKLVDVNTKLTNIVIDNGEITNYICQVNEVLQGSGMINPAPSAQLIYNTNKHLVFSFKSIIDANNNNKIFTLPILTKFSSAEYTWKSSTITWPSGANSHPYFNINNYYQTDLVNNDVVNDLGDNIRYIWIANLERPLSSILQYGDVDEQSLSLLRWIPCSDYHVFDENILQVDRGDTYLQRYDCMRIFSKDTNVDVQQYECVSVLLETFINLDGRYDSRRNLVDVSGMDNTYNKVNTAYSAKDDLFQYQSIDETLFNNNEFPSTFIWSDSKVFGEFVDNYTKLNLSRNYTVNGELGPINKIVNYKNELFGFQDRGLFNILFNQRSMLSTNVGQNILLGSDGRVQGVTYISKNIGSVNKWSIIQDSSSLFFIDDLTKDFYMMANPPQSLSSSLGFKSWANNHFLYTDPYNISETGKDQYILSTDLTNGSLYINNREGSLVFNNRLKQFETFMDHKDIPFMFNFGDRFFSLKNEGTVSIWENNVGRYGQFYGDYYPSYVSYLMNPAPQRDKVFDNFQYRMDVFDYDTGEYVEDKTFSTIEVENEFQKGTIGLNLKDRGLNVRKKFRTWSIPVPRDTLSDRPDRIRNPWIKSTFTFNNYGDRFKLHDLLLFYTI